MIAMFQRSALFRLFRAFIQCLCDGYAASGASRLSPLAVHLSPLCSPYLLGPDPINALRAIRHRRGQRWGRFLC